MKALSIFLLSSLLACTCAAQTDSISRKAMNSAEFNKVLKAVQAEAITNEQAIKNTLANPSNYYTTAQVRRLLAAIPKDSDKLIMARAAYQRVTDPENFAKLADAFKSDTYSREFTYWWQKPDKETIAANKESLKQP